MSAPRCVLPGVTYLVTRRCSERRFFLRPSRIVNAIILYCLALALERHGLELHAHVVLSNHLHLVVTDVRGCLPLFMHHLDLLVARALNAHHGHAEALWASGTYSAVVLPDPETIIEKIAYTLANPVTAGLVARSALWPGLISRPSDLGAPARQVPRPPQFFRHKGATLPETVALALVVPPGLRHLPVAEVRAQVAARLAAHEERARQARRGRPFLGRRAVLLQDPSDRPREPAAQFRLNPRVAGRERRQRLAALERLRRFVAAYRRAWEQFAAGMREALFPAGTWKLRRELGVCCEAPS